MHEKWLPSDTEVACMMAGAQTGIWCCWVYMNAIGAKVTVWNRNPDYPPLDHSFAPVGCVTTKDGMPYDTRRA